MMESQLLRRTASRAVPGSEAKPVEESVNHVFCLDKSFETGCTRAGAGESTRTGLTG